MDTLEIRCCQNSSDMSLYTYMDEETFTLQFDSNNGIYNNNTFIWPPILEKYIQLTSACAMHM